MQVHEIADFVGGELIGKGDVDIFGVAAFKQAGEGHITFIESDLSDVVTAASCVITPIRFAASSKIPQIRVQDPKLAFAQIAALLHPPQSRSEERHPSAVVSNSAQIGNGVNIGAFTYVGDGSAVGDGTQLRHGSHVGENVKIGANCVFHPNVTIEDGCIIGDNVILHSGVVIGADGFGYVRGDRGYVKFPQIGTVVIENDVEIGANSCIDRGALGETRIGSGTKIDNLVQIAHNVKVGKRVIIAAQTGISGSTIIEDDCVIGGQVGMGDHATVKSGAVIGSQAGVLPGKIVRAGVWWGTPVQPLDDYKRQNAHLKGLHRLKRQVETIQRSVDGLLSKSD
jgi:UDP-3-O-[3-hydroxymyristoyl] glucosamine N-acyltransferase